MKLKPIRFAPQEDGNCICGFDPARIRPNDAGRYFCPQSGHEWEEDKPEEEELGSAAIQEAEAGAGPEAEAGGAPTEAGEAEAGATVEETDPATVATVGSEEEPASADATPLS